jgi:hypothetical protein
MGMYLRTTRPQNRDGSEVVYYPLAHNTRHPDSGQTVAQVIHTVGRADELDREALVRLGRSIARVCGVKVEDPLGEPPEVAKGVRDTIPVMSALPEGVTLVGSRRWGLVWRVQALWERLEIGPTPRQVLTPSQDAVCFEQALLAMTAHRLCDPPSKRGVWERWQETVSLPGAEMLTKNEL